MSESEEKQAIKKAEMPPPRLGESDRQGLQPIDMRFYSHSFVAGDPEGDRLRIEYFYRASDGHVLGTVWFGPGSQGPPGHAHGGCIAAVLDETIGAVALVQGRPVVAARLEVRFHRMIPVGSSLFLEAWIERNRGKRLSCSAVIKGSDDAVYATGEALLVKVSGERFEREAAG